MSQHYNNGYRNKFKDGPNDPKKKKKKTRTDHPTWGEIINSAAPHSLRKRKKKIDKEVKKGS